jgi:hypothetical protein
MDLKHISAFGTEYWKDDNGSFHRDDGPAVIHPDGTQFWYQHGVRHRLDGPAIMTSRGECKWYIHGVHINCNSNEEFLRIVKIRSFL